jgi:tetratricopeptide (TPR) repeat protein
LGEYDEALEYFRAYKKDSDYIGASALAGEANILQIQGKSAEAGRLYEQAARLHEDAEFSPRYLMDAGRAYETAGDYARAVQTYQRVEKEYPDAQVAAEAEFYIARASARIVG